jgi:hypothetical protein
MSYYEPLVQFAEDAGVIAARKHFEPSKFRLWFKLGRTAFGGLQDVEGPWTDEIVGC